MSYNGFSNYETWLVCLWIDSEEGSYHYWLGQAEGLTAGELADRLKDEHLENLPVTSGIYCDLLTSALNAVDWLEAAEHILQDIDP